MYLSAVKRTCGKDWENPEKLKLNKDIRKIIPEMYESGNLNSVEIKFEVGYWRKANAIHGWFVKNCQNGEDNCASYYVERKKLELLKAICQEELTVRDADAKTEGELEPVEGFFFGTYEKDEWYYDSLEETIEIINKCLELPEDWSFEYQSSW